jgi:hypothetical protein
MRALYVAAVLSGCAHSHAAPPTIIIEHAAGATSLRPSPDGAYLTTETPHDDERLTVRVLGGTKIAEAEGWAIGDPGDHGEQLVAQPDDHGFTLRWMHEDHARLVEAPGDHRSLRATRAAHRVILESAEWIASIDDTTLEVQSTKTVPLATASVADPARARIYRLIKREKAWTVDALDATTLETVWSRELPITTDNVDEPSALAVTDDGAVLGVLVATLAGTEGVALATDGGAPRSLRVKELPPGLTAVAAIPHTHAVAILHVPWVGKLIGESRSPVFFGISRVDLDRGSASLLFDVSRAALGKKEYDHWSALTPTAMFIDRDGRIHIALKF